MSQPISARGRSAKYRASLRQVGLRPIQIWVPNTRKSEFQAKARAECDRINAADSAEGIMDWVEDTSIFDEHDTR